MLRLRHHQLGLLFVFLAASAWGQVQNCPQNSKWAYCEMGLSNITGSFVQLSFAVPSQLAFATLPQTWVDDHQCDAPGGVYDTDILLGTTVNLGPNGTVSSPYPISFAGLTAAAKNWRDNADNAGGGAHFSDKWWRIRIPAGSLLNATSASKDSNNALWSMPGKMNGAALPTKCLVVESSTPNTAGVMVCAHGLPGFGGAKNPGCTNDIGKMYTLRLDDSTTSGFFVVFGGADPDTPTNFANHVVIRDAEVTVLGSAANFQSQSGVKAPLLVGVRNGSSFIGVERNYIHGFDPGDTGQPVGPCAGWTFSGTANTANTDATHASVTWVSGSRFGMTFSDGVHTYGQADPQATITINGNGYLISSHDPAATDTTLTIVGQPGTLTGASFSLTNPFTNYANGCGSDIEDGIRFDSSNSYVAHNYVEKVHWWGSESHAIETGFTTGPTKFVDNWAQGGSNTWFTGGAPVDTSGGPFTNVEVRRNYFGRDLSYRFLTANAGHSPAPPYGAGPLDKVAGHDNSPMSWAIKNSLEMKLGHNVLVDGNIIEGSWSDGQAGYVTNWTVRVCSGGQTCGIYDPVTGLPTTAIDNIRFSNNWVRNTTQMVQLSVRSGTPGNGGGVGHPLENLDIVNNVFSNGGDLIQFGGAANGDLFQWGGGANKYLCLVTRSSGVAHLQCSTISLTNGTVNQFPTIDGGIKDLSQVSRASNVVTVALNGTRQDPQVGGTVTVTSQDWEPSTTWAINQVIRPAFNNTGGFIYKATVGGKTGSSEPNFNTCQGVSATCTDNTITWTNQNITSTGYEGSFVITGVTNNGASTLCTTNNNTQPQPCVTAAGTFGNAFTYSQTGANNTFCTGTPSTNCDIAGLNFIMPSLAYSITDISVGDSVHIISCSGGLIPSSYIPAGASSTALAIAPTNPAGLDVYYSSPGADDTSGTTCQIDNGSGFPKGAQFAHNDVLLSNTLSLGSLGINLQHLSNVFDGNIFAVTGTNVDVTCINITGEGTPAFACWDPATFQFFSNVLQGRSPGNWSQVNPPPGALNFFPASATCAGAPTSACLGFTQFSNGGATFPVTDCAAANAPYNCTLMTLPWQNNLTLSGLTLLPSSSYLGYGVDIGAMNAAFTSTIYTCPPGLNCGTGPKPD